MRIQRLAMFLEAHFGEVELHMPDPEPPTAAHEPHDGEEDGEDASGRAPALLVRLDEADAVINLLTMVRHSSHSHSKDKTHLIWFDRA